MMRPARQKWLLVLVAILFLTNIATLSIIWFNKKPKHSNQAGEPKRRMGQWMVDQMKLDSVQAAAYWKMRDSVVVLQRPLMDSIRNAKKDFYGLLKQPNVTDSMLHTRSNHVAALQKRLDFVTYRHFKEVQSILHEDQLQKFDTVVKEIVDRMTPFRRNKQDSSGKK
jgi:periplasmic protein CpxP/Spy